MFSCTFEIFGIGITYGSQKFISADCVSETNPRFVCFWERFVIKHQFRGSIPLFPLAQVKNEKFKIVLHVRMIFPKELFPCSIRLFESFNGLIIFSFLKKE